MIIIILSDTDYECHPHRQLSHGSILAFGTPLTEDPDTLSQHQVWTPIGHKVE